MRKIIYLYKQLILHQLLKAKTHMGHGGTSYSATQPYIYGFRNNIAIFDLEKTLVCLRRACNVIDLIIKSKGHLLFINTNPELNKIIKQTADLTNQSYINNKWIGGFLTNCNHMKNVQKHIQQFSTTTTKIKSLQLGCTKAQVDAHNLQQTMSSSSTLTRHVDSHIASRAAFVGPRTEDHLWDRGLSRKQDITEQLKLTLPRFKTMQTYFEGTHGLFNNISYANDIQAPKGRLRFVTETHFVPYRHKSPDCVIIFNANQNLIAIKEASRLQIPIISIVHSNISNEIHSLITYPIPANENSVDFIYLVCNCFLKTILSSQKKMPRH